MLQLGAASALLAVGGAMDRTGRRGGIPFGLAVGTMGAGLDTVAVTKKQESQGPRPGSQFKGGESLKKRTLHTVKVLTTPL